MGNLADFKQWLESSDGGERHWEVKYYRSIDDEQPLVKFASRKLSDNALAAISAGKSMRHHPYDECTPVLTPIAHPHNAPLSYGV